MSATRSAFMKPDKPKVTIIAPALNEEEVLPHFHRELGEVLASLEGQYEFEILYVDDGSSDGTLQLLREWARRDGRVRYLSLSRNFGHQAAFTAGLEHAQGSAVILMDADLQHPPTLLPMLLARWREGHDLVVTMHSKRRKGIFRNLATNCFLRLMSRFSQERLRERMCDFCLLSRRAVDSLVRMRESHRYLRGLVQWLGYSTAEVWFEPPARRAGQTKFNLVRLLTFSLDAIVSFSRVPLRLSFALGMIFLIFGVGVLARGLLGLLIPGWEINAGLVLLLTSIHIVGGSVLCGVGIVGEYVGRIFEQVKGRPIYLLKETEEAVECIDPIRHRPNSQVSAPAA
jgi:polyisoprenyl-phosphate glycosyltransferase